MIIRYVPEGSKIVDKTGIERTIFAAGTLTQIDEFDGEIRQRFFFFKPIPPLGEVLFKNNEEAFELVNVECLELGDRVTIFSPENGMEIQVKIVQIFVAVAFGNVSVLYTAKSLVSNKVYHNITKSMLI